MLLPFWTDGCIGSMEGLYFEASATTPFHFLNQDELSTAPSNAQRGLAYEPGAPTAEQFDLGVDHMQMLGVTYYMAISDGMIAQARANPSLTELTTSGPWAVFQVADAALVEPLENQPAVLTGVSPHDWLDAVEDWYLDPTQWDVYPAAGGPADWQRVAEISSAQEIPTTPVAVTEISAGTDSIEFDVTDVGQPVLVKASYFPNWKAEGAEGPWRVGPNMMVVVPTSTHVELHYGMTSVDWAGWAITLLGVVGLVLLIRARPLAMPDPRPWFRPSEDPDGAPHEGPERVVVAPGESDVGAPVDARPPRTESGVAEGRVGAGTVPASEVDPEAMILGGFMDPPRRPDPPVPPSADET
jgi:hypothetical protein